MKIALCCIAKCENLYLSEWVNYHLNLGFDHIYIYDNNDTDGERCEDVIGKENPNVTVLTTYIGKKQKGCETQIRAYNDFYKTFGKKYDWVLFSDVDEFLVLNKHTNVNDYISSITDKKTKCVKLNWKCYGDNEQLHYENKPVVERFTKECDNKEENRFYKSFYKTKISGFELINVHYSLYVSTIVDCDGNEMKYEKNVKTKTVNTNSAYFAHYVTKSADEYYQIKKKRRSPGVSDNRLTIGHYFKYNTRTKEKEDYLLSLFNESKNPNEIIQNVCDYPFGVSVCISAWKTSEYIEECLDSVSNQTWFKNHNNYEILLGIDGCNETLDKVKEIMHKYKNIKVMMMDKNVGTYVTCNTIMKEAKYEWLLRFDSDDIMLPNMIETIMNEKDDSDFINTKCYKGFSNSEIYNNVDGQITIKKNIFIKYGGFQNWKCAADTELKIRLKSCIKEKTINKPLFYYRINNVTSLTHDKKTKFGSDYRQEKRKYIETNSKETPFIHLKTSEFSLISSYINYDEKKYSNEQTIVSLTSWKNRIKNTHKAIESILQHCKKSYVILVLSEEEFPNKENELPQTILDLLYSKKIEILWTYDNTKAFKKVMPTMEKYKGIPIVSADDDLLYTRDFATELYEKYAKNKNVFSVSYRHSKMVTNCGAATLYNPKYYNLILSSFNKKFVDFYEDDMFMQFISEKNKLQQVFLGDDFPCKMFDKNDKTALSILYKNNKTPNERKTRYFSEFEKIINAKVIVNITTWKKREHCLYKMLSNLKKQTLKANKIILWLSEEEYDKTKLSLNIQKCVNDNLITDIQWVKKNTKGHKRYECFKYYNDCYNILLDDDILYKPTFIKELINESKKNQNCITVYSSYGVEYSGVHITRTQYYKEPSHKNNFIAGRCCFPPYIFPLDAYNDEELRNEYVINCDESWYRPFFIKHNIKINVIHQWDNTHYPTIDDSQNDCLWNINGRVYDNGIREKERNFYNAIKITHTENLCKKIWSDIGIDNYKIQK